MRHFRPAEVEVAVLEPQLLVYFGGLVDVEGRRQRLVEHLARSGTTSISPVTMFGFRSAGSTTDVAFDREHPLGARTVGDGVALRLVRVEDDLDDPVGSRRSMKMRPP